MSAPLARIGFTLVAPDTVYPRHAHPAIERYWVLSGHTLWSNSRWERRVPPGEWILHASNEPHAMRTSDEPLLALWGWSGDIDTAAVYV